MPSSNSVVSNIKQALDTADHWQRSRIGNKSSEPGPPCGVALPGVGELLIGVTPPDPVLLVGGGVTWTGAPLAFNQSIPFDVALISVKLYVQSILADLTGVASPSEPFRLTGGLEIQIGSG